MRLTKFRVDIPEETKTAPGHYPSLHSHSVYHTSIELKKFDGPLREYLTISAEETNDPGLLQILAELELNDWLEGRRNDITRAFDYFWKTRSGGYFQVGLINPLARMLQKPLERSAKEELTTCLEKAFCDGLTVAIIQMKEINPQWASDNLWLQQNIDSDTIKDIQNSGSLSVAEAFSRVFPDLDIDLCNSVLSTETGNLAIHLASQARSSMLLEQLLHLPGIDVNCKNKYSETPLLLACRSGRFATAMLLIESGADVAARNDFGENPLHWIHSFRFSPKKMEELAEKLVSKSSSTVLCAVARETPSNDFLEYPLIEGTPICRAIVKGCLEAVRVLWRLESEAFPTKKPNLSAAASLAARLHNADMLDILLTGPMDLINKETGVSILGDALRTGTLHGSGVARILRHGERCKESGISTLKVLCKYGASRQFDEVPGYPGCNVLSISCSLISPEAVEFLLADLNCSKYVNIFTPPPGIANKAFVEGSVMYGLDSWRTHLLYSVMICGRPRVFQLLLDYGADPNLKIHSGQGRQLTILHMCVIGSQDTTFVKMLLKTAKIADVDTAPDDFESPFATAVRMRKLDIAHCLLEHGADVNRFSLKGYNFSTDKPRRMTVLAHLLYMGDASLSSLACINFLLGTKKASIYTTPEKDETVLHALAFKTNSSERENTMFVRRIFELFNSFFRFTKVQLDLRRYGTTSTALELAVINNKAAVVDELLRAGASVDIRASGPDREDTALELALKHIYFFPQRVTIEDGFLSKEKQLQEAFERRTRIALLLSQMALKNIRSEFQ